MSTLYFLPFDYIWPVYYDAFSFTSKSYNIPWISPFEDMINTILFALLFAGGYLVHDAISF